MGIRVRVLPPKSPLKYPQQYLKSNSKSTYQNYEIQAENRKKLFNHLKTEMSEDRAKHKILPPSKFGLIQINGKFSNKFTISKLKGKLCVIFYIHDFLFMAYLES